MINNIYNSGKIPRKWKIARVILLTKLGKDRPPLSNSILLSMNEVWENTIKNTIEKHLGQDSYHNKQYIMQLLTGHGIFNSYTMRLNKENSNQC